METIYYTQPILRSFWSKIYWRSSCFHSLINLFLFSLFGFAFGVSFLLMNRAKIFVNNDSNDDNDNPMVPNWNFQFFFDLIWFLYSKTFVGINGNSKKRKQFFQSFLASLKSQVRKFCRKIKNEKTVNWHIVKCHFFYPSICLYFCVFFFWIYIEFFFSNKLRLADVKGQQIIYLYKYLKEGEKNENIKNKNKNEKNTFFDVNDRWKKKNGS